MTTAIKERPILLGFSGFGEFIDSFYAINEGRVDVRSNPWVWAITFRVTEPQG